MLFSIVKCQNITTVLSVKELGTVKISTMLLLTTSLLMIPMVMVKSTMVIILMPVT